MRTMNYGVGDTVVYRDFLGGERVTVVTEREADVKNGRPGFVGYVQMTAIEAAQERAATGMMLEGPMGDRFPVWGYDSQIIEVRPA